MRVLVAGESPLERRFAEALLAVLGYESDSVGDGRAVAEAVARRHYDLVLTDVELDDRERAHHPRMVRMPPQGQPLTLDELQAALVGDQVIDPRGIERLFEDCSPRRVKELVRTFLRDAETRIKAIHAAEAARDAEALETAARELRGSSAMVAAAALGRAAGEVLTLAKGGRTGGPPLQRIDRAWADTREALAERFPER